MSEQISIIKQKAKAREEFILKRERAIGRKLSGLESELINQVLDKFLTLVINSKGVVTYKGSMITLTQALDKIFDRFNSNENLNVIRGIVTDFSTLSELNAEYYSSFLTKDKSLKEIKKAVDLEMKNRLGLGEGNKFMKGGFLDSFVSDNYLRDYLKKYTYKAVTGGAKYSDFLKGLRNIIQGAPEQDSMLARHYKTFAFDAYAQFDRSIGNQWRNKLGLKAALYSGGIIETSREFCIDHNNKVFTIEEMEKWKDDPKLPRTKEERKLGKLIGYIPWVDAGRWNCRHQINWVSKTIAIKLRPELRSYYEAL